MKTKIIRYFNQGASTYHSVAEVQSYVAQQLAVRMRHLHASHILEIGCGTGLLSQHIVSLFPQAQLLLTDIAPEMLNMCNERFATHSNIHVLRADGESSAINNTFDLITSSMTLHWFENIESGFKNIIDKLSANGTFVFALLGDSSLHEWRQMCEQTGILPATLVFPKANALKEKFPELKIDVEFYKQSYTSAYSFVHSLKQLGARAPYAHHTPASSGKLRRLFRHYADEIDITYEIIYGCYTKC